MKIGLVVRGERGRGLGIQSRAIYDNLKPVKVLAIDPGKLSPYPQDFAQYPGAVIVGWNGNETCVDHELLDEFCRGLDCCLSIETMYDPHLPDIARKHDVATCLMLNPEFHRHATEPNLPAPTMFWNPTTWRSDELSIAHYVPMPITLHPTARPRHHAAMFLHVAGHRASRDRNGTRAVIQSLRQTKAPVTIRTQTPIPPVRSPNITVQHRNFPTTNDLFAGADCLILPRRYAGLSLVMDEALARGMPVIASDRIPERDWLPPDTLVPAPINGIVHTPAGHIPTHNPMPAAIAKTVNRLHQDQELFAKLSWAALDEADSRSWAKLKPLWTRKLEECIDVSRG